MRNLLLVLYFVFVCFADEFYEDSKQTSISEQRQNSILQQKIKDYTAILTVEHAIENIQRLASKAEDEDKYNEIAKGLESLINTLKVERNTDSSLNIDEIDQVILKLINVNNENVKKLILILIRALFEIAPDLTKEKLSINIVDKVLDVFENDNLALKAYAVDVMSIWLPKNPKIQARVMKLKGLEPFYEQLFKFDANVINTLLDLFNNILAEHVTERVKNKDIDTRILYQKIGLIERMSTPTVCDGILNIFNVILPVKDDKQLTVIYNLIKNIKPFCLKFYKRNKQATTVFEELKNYLDNLDRNESFTSEINFTEIKIMLEDFIQISYSRRDEF